MLRSANHGGSEVVEFGLEYTTDTGSLVYGRVARGQKAGPLTDAPDAIANGGFFTPADEETVLSFEAGIKKRLYGS